MDTRRQLTKLILIQSDLKKTVFAPCYMQPFVAVLNPKLLEDIKRVFFEIARVVTTCGVFPYSKRKQKFKSKCWKKRKKKASYWKHSIKHREKKFCANCNAKSATKLIIKKCFIFLIEQHVSVKNSLPDYRVQVSDKVGWLPGAVVIFALNRIKQLVTS